MAAPPYRHATQLPASQHFAGDAGSIQELFPGAERQLVDGAQHQVVAHVEDAWAPVAPAAQDVLRSVGLPAAYRTVVDGMRPHVLRAPHPAVRQGALERDIQRVEK